MCGSRFCSPAESYYSPVEGELLAVTWALKKTRIFTLGATNLYVVTDHKPLVGLIKGVEKAKNQRLTWGLIVDTAYSIFKSPRDRLCNDNRVRMSRGIAHYFEIRYGDIRAIL